MAKYKVGDKVVVRKDLKDNNIYDSVIATEEMEEFAGKTVTITRVKTGAYNIKEDHGEWNWSDGMFESKVRKSKTDEMIDIVQENFEKNTKNLERIGDYFHDSARAIEELIGKVNERTLYDDVVMQQMMEKVKEVSIEDLTGKVCEEANKYIKDTYGILPRKIEIKDGAVTREMVGLFHKKFDEILQIVNKGVPLMLTGPAGAGKNHTLEQVAEALDLDFYFTNAITQEFKLTGFIDANGVYQETQFYKAFKDGGVFFLDEIDASCPESLIILNSAIANGYFDFPNGRVDVNEKFRVVCAGNTFGTGADMIYVGRNALDGATLDRFATIEFDYDEDVEKQLAFDDELYNFIKALRKAIKEASLRYIVSMRATINATKLLEIGMSKEDILKSVIIKNMQIDDLNTIIKKINDSSDWKKSLEKIKDARN